MLRVSGLTKQFAGLTALRDVTFDVSPGEILGLIGPNGAGKSTLVNCVAGAFAPTAGTATWKGSVLTGRSPEAIVGAGVRRTFQQPRLFPDSTVLDNVKVGAHPLGRSGFVGAILRLPTTRRDERLLRDAALDALDAVGCVHLADEDASALTAGQSRLVGVARSLAGNPELLLLDEPAAGLNDVETERLAHDLRRLMARRPLTMVVIEHHMPFVMGLSDRLVVLSFGEVIASGKPNDVRTDPAVVSAYIGAS